MPQTSERPPWPPLTKKGEPRKKRGPKPKAPHEKEWKEPKAIVRPQLSYSKKRRQDVLLWMLNHRIEDVEGNSGARYVEKEPRKMPDGSEQWFRGPTSNETANFWKIPQRTISTWWKDREKIFEGVVPESAIPLVHPSQRNRPKAPPAPRPPAPDPPAKKSHPAEPSHNQGIAPIPLPASALRMSQPGPRLAPGSVVYPQAVQPSGAPMHPLYRADFALIEVSNEVHHLMQNQHNIQMEKLLRAIALSQALVNDLTEAHKVLLDPQSYPQYYLPPPQPPPPPQQLAGPLSRTDTVRSTVNQPASIHAHPSITFRTPQAQQAFPQKRQKRQPPLPPTRPGLREGEFIWRLTSSGQQPLQTAKEVSVAVAEQNKSSSSLKRGYNSPDGPNGTVEAPIVVEEDEVGGAAGGKEPTRLEVRRSSASYAGEIEEDTAIADRASESDVSAEDVGKTHASDGSSAHHDAGASSDQPNMPSADTHTVEQGDANTTEQSSPNTSENSLETELLDASEAADAEDSFQEGSNHQPRIREDSRESSHSDIADVASVASSTTGQKRSTIDEQPAESPASAEGSAGEQKRQEH